MRVLVAAPADKLDAFTRATRDALGVRDDASSAFAHDRSRDPTLDLPHRVFEERPELVVVIDPRREDPSTIEALRRFGARVVIVFDAIDESAGRSVEARRRWIAHAADGVLGQEAFGASCAVDRHGRAALPFTVASFGAALIAAVAAIPTDPA